MPSWIRLPGAAPVFDAWARGLSRSRFACPALDWTRRCSESAPSRLIPFLRFSDRFALGVAPHGKEYRLAIRLQRVALRDSPIVDHLKSEAKGEVDIRMVGRIDKRAKKRQPTVPWYRGNTRPLLMGASVGHVDVTAGTLGAFVSRSGAICILSNNHVLANEDAGSTGDMILQRAKFDGGRAAGGRSRPPLCTGYG